MCLERDIKQSKIAAQLGCSQMQVSRRASHATARLSEMVDHASDERKAHDQFEHPVGRQLGGVEERGGRAAAGENDGDPILRRAARWLILKGQQHEHQQDGRRRLLVLYGEGIDIDGHQRDLVERSEGVSGAFTKELTGQAWLRDALERRDGPTTEVLRASSTSCLRKRSTLDQTAARPAGRRQRGRARRRRLSRDGARPQRSRTPNPALALALNRR